MDGLRPCDSNFNDCALTNSLPTEMGNLVNLQTLQMNNNKFNSTLPTEIGNLGALATFSVAGPSSTASVPFGRISGAVPTEVGTMISLKNFWVQTQALNSTLPTEFALTPIKSIQLHANKLVGPLDPVFSTIKTLVNLCASPRAR